MFAKRPRRLPVPRATKTGANQHTGAADRSPSPSGVVGVGQEDLPFRTSSQLANPRLRTVNVCRLRGKKRYPGAKPG